MIASLSVNSTVLSRTSGGGRDRFWLEMPELVLRRGEGIALTGPSGSGKTTCLEFLAFLVAPTRLGHYVLNGHDLTRDLKRGRLDKLARLRTGAVGYAPQLGSLLPFLNAGDDARTALLLSGARREKSLIDRFTRIAGKLRLLPILNRKRDQLSGGERKRVTLLRALAIPRELLLLDEPTSALDEEMADIVMSLIQQITREEGSVCVISSHEPDKALACGFSLLGITPGNGSITSAAGLSLHRGTPGC